MKQAVLGLLALLGMTLSANSSAQSGLPFKYSVDSVTTEDLGSLGEGAYATDINDAGDVVGRSWNSSGTGQAFLHRDGVMQNVGSSSSFQPSYGYGINNLGEVVGLYHDPDVDQAMPFFWKEGIGRITLSRSVHPGARFDHQYIGGATAINDSGQITGRVYAPGSAVPNDIPNEVCHKRVPTIWPNWASLPQILYCSDSIATVHTGLDINSSGWIVGWEDGTFDKGFVWKNGITTFVPMPVGGMTNLVASGINDAGVVVGEASNGTANRAIMWDGVSATSQWLGALPGGTSSRAYDVNEAKFVAGTSETFVLAGYYFVVRNRAYIYHRHFGMHALPVLPGLPEATTDCAGRALNNRVASTGIIQVVGQCRPTPGSGGQNHAIRWNVTVSTKPLPPSFP